MLVFSQKDDYVCGGVFDDLDDLDGFSYF